MTSLFASGRVVDLILGLIALEAVALAVYRSRTGRGLAVPRFAGFLLSGAFLMLALRAALVDAWWGWIALCLGASLVAHLVDLRQRWIGRL